MSHVDGNLRGIEPLAARLIKATEGDLNGFSLYLTTNYTLTLRFFLLFATTALLHWVHGVATFFAWLGLLVCVAWFGFGSLFAICRYACRTFGKCVTPDTPLQLWGRVEVTVDAASKVGPDTAREETLPIARSIDRYGPPPGWRAGQRDATPDREEGEKRKSLRDALLRDVAESLVAFQREYALCTGNGSDAMPGNEDYRAKLVEIASKARTALEAVRPATPEDARQYESTEKRLLPRDKENTDG
jgi:hypothetical protein